MQHSPRKTSPESARAQHPPRLGFALRHLRRIGLFLLSCITVIGIGLYSTRVHAQSDSDLRQEENQLIREFVLPSPAPQAPVYRPRPAPQAPRPAPAAQQRPAPSAPPRSTSTAPSTPAEPEETPEVTAEEPTETSSETYQYVLEFNRSPVVGTGFHLQGLYATGRLGFTRPKSWNLKSAKALIRFQHSPALLASRSNLTVRVNGTSLSSVPLNRKQAEVGEVLFNIPTNLIQDYNDIAVIAQQTNTADACPRPGDPTLWTDVLPDSKLLFEFEPRSVTLDLGSYPYPVFDQLSLDANRMTYLMPAQMSEAWMTQAARFHTSLGRLADFRSVDTAIAQSTDEVSADRKLIVIGTPEEQPALRSLDLPLQVEGNQILDGNQLPLPGDVGVVMLTTTSDSGALALVATGNSPEGVAKAVQLLVQPEDLKIATGQFVTVNQITDVPSPELRDWPQFLPLDNSFQLQDLKTVNNEPFTDVTVRGSSAPPVEFDFRALPDDQFKRGSSMNLHYSYGPQINPRNSAVEVLLDGVAIGGERLSSENGSDSERLKVDLPANLVTPTSRIQVFFRLNPREVDTCGQSADQQLWGTVHADTSFNLKRETSVQLPDLEKFLVGFPFAAPQDLSNTAVVLPDTPSQTDVMTLLKLSERLGRLSRADSVKLDVYTTGSLPVEVREQKHLVGIGVREQFPFPEVFQSSNGFALRELFARQKDQSQLQTLPDQEGVVKEIISPWNGDRVLLALSAQTETGLERVHTILDQDAWFFRLQGDTTLISAGVGNAAMFDADAFELEFLQQENQRRIENTSLLSKATRVLQENWFLVPTGVVLIAILFYGIAEFYLKRVASQRK